MTISTLLVVVALLYAPAQGATPAAGQAPTAEAVSPNQGRYVEETLLDRQTREVSSKLRCVVCQGLSLQDSPSQLAQEMRAIVREKLEEGMTPDEVKAYFVEKYGEWVLLQPDPRGFNLLVYIMPVAILFGGAGFVFFKARSWTRRPDDGFAAEAADEEETELTPR
ncbi:MAG TPA: cytochrome c-type biogenesis protein [Longimicrobiales bacterium]|nr:cytochrome c-type biogenesis protein [Longimicrobiales bacterium]